MNVLPPDAVRGHGVLRVVHPVQPLGVQRRDDFIGVHGLGEIVERAELDRDDGRRDRAVARRE